MRLLIDMNLSPRWVEWLGREGFDAVHWSTVGRPGAPDKEIVEFARSENRIVLTHDLDFGAILAATRSVKPSVVQIRSDDLRPEKIGPAVVTALEAMREYLEVGALLTIDPSRRRVRLLPIEN
jgi:predicted nuclease of predicted toxin-antitoxin system